MSYLIVSTDYVLNNTNNETVFPDMIIVSEEYFKIKFQEVSVLKYQNFRIYQSPLGFSVDHTDHIMELVNEWLPTGNFRNFDAHFSIYFIY